jgi:hypothetical protein
MDTYEEPIGNTTVDPDVIQPRSAWQHLEFRAYAAWHPDRLDWMTWLRNTTPRE